MTIKKHNVSHWLIRLPLLLVYTLFFCIQLFFYLDTSHCFLEPGGYTEIFPTTFGKTTVQKETASEKKITNEAKRKLKFRFNKKFWPSNMACEITTIKELPPLYFEPLVLVDYINHYQSTRLINVVTLRGPPAVA